MVAYHSQFDGGNPFGKSGTLSHRSISSDRLGFSFHLALCSDWNTICKWNLLLTLVFFLAEIPLQGACSREKKEKKNAKCKSNAKRAPSLQRYGNNPLLTSFILLLTQQKLWLDLSINPMLTTLFTAVTSNYSPNKTRMIVPTQRTICLRWSPWNTSVLQEFA